MKRRDSFKKQFTQLRRQLFAVAVVACCATMAFSYAHSANATPGSPGVPEAPTVVYNEDFQNTPSYAPVLLTSYTGASGMTYTANAKWLTACNGEVIAFNTDDSAFASSNCSVGDGGSGSGTNLTKAFDQVRRMAHALGSLNGATSPATNKALTAYTDYGNIYADPGANLVQFQTQSTISLPGGTRKFLISRVDSAAVNCTAPDTEQGKLVFYLLDGGTPRRVNQSPINVCTDTDATSYTPPTLNTNGALGPSNDAVLAGRIITDTALLSNTTTIGVRMVNQEGSGQGNDNALDNIQIEDASPKLDKSFNPVSVPVGSTSRMTFTVTNTSDLLAKPGWSFSDTLPENVVVAEAPNATSDCPNYAIGYPNNKKVVNYSGDLSAGQVSCTLSIDVTSAVAGTYTNGPSNLSDVVGLQPPADADVTFTPKAPDTGRAAINTSTYLLTGLVATVLVGLALGRKKLLQLVRR